MIALWSCGLLMACRAAGGNGGKLVSVCAQPNLERKYLYE